MAYVVPPLAILLGIVALATPMYANAQAAVGVQLLALAGMTLLEGARPRVVAAAALGVVGAVLAARSDAAIVVGAVVVVVAVGVVALGWAPPKWAVVTAAAGALVAAAGGVVWLAGRESWPGRLTAGLSEVRHELWRDALALWREHPIAGGGPGWFVANSPLASSDADLAAAHSSVLQVAAEFGLVGVVGFALLLAAGIAVAARGPRGVAAIAIAAWAALGVHSMIDHLWEFPAVVLAAGLVLAWSGFGSSGAGRPVDSPPR